MLSIFCQYQYYVYTFLFKKYINYSIFFVKLIILLFKISLKTKIIYVIIKVLFKIKINLNKEV